MKRIVVSVLAGLMMATLAAPAYAEDSTTGTSTEASSQTEVSTSVTAEVDLTKYFTAEELAKLTEKELARLKAKIQHRLTKDAKHEAKLRAEYDRLLQKKKKQAEAMARRQARTKVLQAHVASVDAEKGIIYLKRGVGVQVTSKTVLTVVEADGGRVGTLADFQAGDRIFGLVRKSPGTPNDLTGVVIIKLLVQTGGGNDEDDDD